METAADAVAPLRGFVQDLTRLAAAGRSEPELLAAVAPALAGLVAEDGWLAEAFRRPHPEHYQQYLLHCDPLERFSVVSFVWGPGQRTPVHDHGVWGAVGLLQGAELVRDFLRDAAGRLEPGAERRLEPGEVVTFTPDAGDIHAVRNAFDDRVSISIHVYGGNIGAQRRRVFDAETGAAKPFVSGYAAAVQPNLWDRSAAVRAGG